MLVCFFTFQNCPSASVVSKIAAMLCCCEATEIFCGLQKLHPIFLQLEGERDNISISLSRTLCLVLISTLACNVYKIVLQNDLGSTAIVIKLTC